MKDHAKLSSLAAVMTVVILMTALTVSGEMLLAQAPPASNSEKAKTTSSGEKPASTKPADSATVSKGDASTTQDSKTRTSTPSAKQQKPPRTGAGMVWVNTESGVYHEPGTRWYGKTKKGKYMLETDAIKAGYKPAKK
jgi:septal ring-binding cell division protein DamX